MPQTVKKTHIRVEVSLHRALKIASIQADMSLEEVLDEVIREGMKAKGIPLPDRKPPKVQGRQSAHRVQA